MQTGTAQDIVLRPVNDYVAEFARHEDFSAHKDFSADAGLPPGLVIASVTLPLQRIIQLRQLTGHPVSLAQDNVVGGVCDECEIVRALAGKGRQGS